MDQLTKIDKRKGALQEMGDAFEKINQFIYSVEN